MNLRMLVWRELWLRKSRLATSLLAVLLGVAAIVAIQTTSHHSEAAVAREMEALGANLLVLPPSATLQNYYAADLQTARMPEEYVTRLALSNIAGLDHLSPRLAVPVEVAGHAFTLTGVLPTSEFQAKAAWKGAGLFSFSEPTGCGSHSCTAGTKSDEATGLRRRSIETLARDEALLGSEVASALGLDEGDRFDVMQQTFRVSKVLSASGTLDDARLFVHLHTVQELADTGPVISAIEVIACCEEIQQGLLPKVQELLPETKVVTIAQVAATQMNVNRTMRNLSLVLLVMLVAIGGASIANYMVANVHERRREIGTLMALGATSRLIVKLLLAKAFLLGLAGGLGGFAVGSAIAALLGPQLAGVAVSPLPLLTVHAVLLSTAVALAASALPAWRATRLDPSAIFSEASS